MKGLVFILHKRREELLSRAISGEEREELFYLETAIGQAEQHKAAREKAIAIERAKEKLNDLGVSLDLYLSDDSTIEIKIKGETVLNLNGENDISL